MSDPGSEANADLNESLNQRKQGHIEVCLDPSVDLRRDSFADLKLRYNALPELALSEVSTETRFAERAIAAPLIISSMTGGVGEEFRRLNSNLAAAAERLRVPLGLGSMKVMVEDEAAAPSFEVRDLAPSVPLIANLGLVSFNYGLAWDHAAHIIERIRPDVFGLHLNALQESIQEGGDTDFRNLTSHLEDFVQRCPLPVYVKECGGGIAPELVETIAGLGVSYIDVSGSDGTSWAAVEARLSPDPSFGEMFSDFGLPTRWILERIDPDRTGPARIVASGGIRNGIQATKALALGADYVAVARPFLIAARESADAVVAAGERLFREMRTTMFLVGARNVAELDRKLLLRPE